MSLQRNTLWNLAGNGFPLVAGAVAVPYLMNSLGTERFGIVTLIWTLIGYMSLFDFGLGRALTQLTAANIGNGNYDKNQGLLKTSVFLTAIAGSIGASILLALSYPLAFFWLNVSSEIQTDVFYSLAFTSIAVPVTTISAALRGGLEGYEKFKEVNVVKIFFGAACFAFPVLAVFVADANLLNVTISLVIARLITLIMLQGRLKCVYDMGIFSFQYDKHHRRELLSFGSWMTLSNIISPIMVNFDRYIISGVLGAVIVAYYTVPFEIIVRLLIVPGAIGIALFPRLSGLFYSDDTEAYRLINKCVLLSAVILFICCSIIVICYIPAVSLWINEDFANKSFSIISILAVGTFLNGIAYVYYTAVQARNGSRVTGILHLFELIVYVPLLFCLVKKYGIIGAASAWTIRIAVDCFMLYMIYRRGRRSVV